MKSYLAKTDELNRQWYVIDATDAVVGRLAAQIAPILMGKHRPTYTPYVDTGDFVIVTNVDKVVFTGNKWEQKSYQRFSGYPGGQRDEQAKKLFARHPERILKLVVGPNHNHQAQQPVALETIKGRPAAEGRRAAAAV